uniref:uncharacterized protein LOC122595322 n=1 Tax=Erigeron canadensis TaxID=72917 RepID=UPI001CB9AE24|nr:uncharacterized protein LOC122595322 [Erigeron canadensis]
MSDDEQLPVKIIPEFGSSDFSSSLSFGGFEFLASVALATLEKDNASTFSTRRFIWSDQYTAHEKLMAMYFVDDPMFDDEVFRMRYCMSKRLFLKIIEDITASFSWFRDSVNVVGTRGFSSIQSARARYDNLADHYDEGLSFSTRTARECLDNFCIAIKHLYGEEYLPSPASHDVARLYEAHEARHHFLGMINMLKQSPLFIPEANGKSLEYGVYYKRSPLQYTIVGYYLGDGIYPYWSYFVKVYAYLVAH